MQKEVSMGGQRNVPLWGGLPKQNAKAMARDARLVMLGIGLLAVGFILQALSVIFASPCPPS